MYKENNVLATEISERMQEDLQAVMNEHGRETRAGSGWIGYTYYDYLTPGTVKKLNRQQDKYIFTLPEGSNRKALIIEDKKEGHSLLKSYNTIVSEVIKISDDIDMIKTDSYSQTTSRHQLEYEYSYLWYTAPDYLQSREHPRGKQIHQGASLRYIIGAVGGYKNYTPAIHGIICSTEDKKLIYAEDNSYYWVDFEENKHYMPEGYKRRI